MWLYRDEALKPGYQGLRGAGEACDLLIFGIFSRKIAIFGRFCAVDTGELLGIITKSAKGVYQKHGYMRAPPKPKIGLANTAM